MGNKDKRTNHWTMKVKYRPATTVQNLFDKSKRPSGVVYGTAASSTAVSSACNIPCS